jgi:hypothetical protein
MVEKWAAFFLLAQLALLIGGDVIPLDDVELQLLQLPSGEEEIKEQESKLESQERNALSASQAASRSRNEADRAYRNVLRVSDRLMDGKHRLQAAQDTVGRAKQERRDAKADLVRAENELMHQQLVQKQLNDDVESQIGKAKKALGTAEDQGNGARKRVTKLLAEKQHSEDKAREQSQQASRAAGAAVAALSELQQELRSAVTAALDASVARNAKNVALEQQGIRVRTLSGDRNAVELEKAKAQEASLATERIQEKMEAANSAAQSATSDALAEKGREATAVAEARNQKELADEAVESESAQLATLEESVTMLKSKEADGADHLKSQKAVVQQMDEVMAEKQSQYMKDQLKFGQESTMAETKDTPELKVAHNAVSQGQKAVKEARATEQEAHRAVKAAKEEVHKSEYALSDAKVEQDEEVRRQKDLTAAAEKSVSEEELKVKNARKAAKALTQKLKEDQARQVAEDKVRQEALAETATKKAAVQAQLEGELGASKAAEEAEKERLRTIKQEANSVSMKVEQEQVRQRQLEEARAATREAALAAEKRNSDKASEALKQKAAHDARDLERTAQDAKGKAEENAKKLEEQFVEAQKQSAADAALDVQKSEGKAKREKQAADDKTAHMLAQAQSSPATPCNSTDMDASDMAQEALEASQQEANAMMAVESAALGKQVAQQVEAEVSGAKQEAKGMMRDNRAMSIKERKTAREELKRRQKMAKEKEDGQTLLVSQAKEAATQIQQAARADAAAVKAEIQAAEKSARNTAKGEQEAKEKEAELKMEEEEEKVRRKKIESNAISATVRAARQSNENGKAEIKKMEVEISEMKEAALHQLHHQQQQEKRMIEIQLKGLYTMEDKLKAQKKRALDVSADNHVVIGAETLLQKSKQGLVAAQESVKHAEQVKQGAKEELTKLQDKLEDVQAAVALKKRQSRERLGEVERVHSLSEADYHKAQQNYKAEQAKYMQIREAWRQAKSSLDKNSAEVTRSKLVLEQYQRQAEQRDSDWRRAVGEQSMNDDKVKLTEDQAKQKAKWESEQFSEAEQEMRSEQQTADAQEQKLESDKQEAVASVLRGEAKAKAEYAELEQKEASAVRKKTELESKEQGMVNNVEATKAAVLELAVTQKSETVQMEHKIQQAKQEQSEWAAKKQILQNKLQRLQAEMAMRQANQQNLVDSANAHKRLAAQELTASQTREDEARKAAEEAQAKVIQIEKELADAEMLHKKLESKSKQLEMVADARSKSRDEAAAKLDQLRRLQEEDERSAAKTRIKQSQNNAHSARNQANEAIDHAKDAKLQAEKHITKYELEVKDHEAELNVEKRDQLAASRLTVRKAQSEAEKVITQAEGAANRARLRADAADEKLQLVNKESQKQNKIAKDQAYEAVREAKMRATEAGALIKQRQRELKKGAGDAKRAASKRNDLVAAKKTAEAELGRKEKRLSKLTRKRDRIESRSMARLSEAKKSHHAVSVRAQGYERQLDALKESASAAQLSADKQARILESEKDRLRDATRVANDEMATAQRDAKFAVSKSQADLESTRREEEDRQTDVQSELDSQLATLKSKLNQQVSRAKQEAQQQLEQKKQAFQLEIDQAKRSESDAADRRKQFEDQTREHKDALKAANEKIATMKAATESLRNSLFTKIDKDDNGSIDREEFASPFDSEASE